MHSIRQGYWNNKAWIIALAVMGTMAGTGAAQWAMATPVASSPSQTTQTPEDTWSPAGTDVTAVSDPWVEMQQFQDRMDQLFANAFNKGAMLNNGAGFAVPNMNLHDDKDHYEVTMDLPGADKGTIKVNVEGRFLSVSGQEKTDQEMKTDGKVVGDEQSQSQFERTITLPGPVNVAAIDAKYDKGVLTVDLPKASPTPEPTSIPVH